jgi:CheY-like chemotaxis protein
VRLPVAAQATACERAEFQDSTLNGAEKLRILLVDDNADFATSMSILLQTLGHDVRVANDAREAMTIARDFGPHFAFLDIGLPEINGYQLAGQLRTQPETQETTLVAVSGWGQMKDRMRSREAGFVTHLVKPVALDQIRTVLNKG